MTNAKQTRRAPQHRRTTGRHREPVRTVGDLTLAPATTSAKIAAVGVIGTATALGAPAAAFAGTGSGPGGSSTSTVNIAPAPVGFGYRACAFYCLQGGYTYTPDQGFAVQLGTGVGTPQAGPIVNYNPYSSAIGVEGGAQIPGFSASAGLNTSSGLYANGKTPIGNFNWSDANGLTVNYGIVPTGLTQLGANPKIGAQGMLLGSLNFRDLGNWLTNVLGLNPPSNQPIYNPDGSVSYPPGYVPPPAHLTDWSGAFGPDELNKAQQPGSGQQPGGQQGAPQDNGGPQGGAPQGGAPQDNGGPQGGAPQGGAPQDGGGQQGGGGQPGGAPAGGAPQGAAPQDGSAPQGGAPQGAAPQDGSAPQGGAPQGAAPQDGSAPQGAAPASGQQSGAAQPTDPNAATAAAPAAGSTDPAAAAAAAAGSTDPAAAAAAAAAFGPTAPVPNPTIGGLPNGQTFSSTSLGTNTDPLAGTGAPQSGISGTNTGTALAGTPVTGALSTPTTGALSSPTTGGTGLFAGDPSAGSTGGGGGFSAVGSG